jgi:hypothetical protein
MTGVESRNLREQFEMSEPVDEPAPSTGSGTCEPAEQFECGSNQRRARRVGSPSFRRGACRRSNAVSEEQCRMCAPHLLHRHKPRPVQVCMSNKVLPSPDASALRPTICI